MSNPPRDPIDQRARYWHQLLTRSGSVQVESIRFIESNIFSPQLIEIPRALAIVGLHGTGKTLFLHTLEAITGYTWPTYSPPFFDRGITYSPDITPIDGVIEVALRTDDGVVTRTVDLSDPPEKRLELWQDTLHPYSAYYVGPITAFHSLSYLYDHYLFHDTHDESEPERKLSSAELRALRNILGRTYDRVTIRSAVAEPASDEMGELRLPYVSAWSGSRRVDSRTMSHGELWVHYVLNWFLTDEIDVGGVALIDEPEAFLAPRAHRPFIDEIARLAVRRKLQLIIATHSSDVLARFPIDNIRLSIQADDGIRIIKPASLFQIRDSIGIETPLRAIIFVEDELAKQLLTALFARYDIALTREVDIIPAGGVSEVISGLRVLRNSGRLSCMGVLDGDQRTKVESDAGLSNYPLFFLPGDDCPEEELLAGAAREASWLAGTMGVTTNDIMVAISSCRNVDHQYQIRRLATQLGCAELTMIYMLARAWLRSERISSSAENLVTNLELQLSGSRNY